MTVTCLDLIGAGGPLIVEGPFAKNALYLKALHNLTQREVFASEATTGTAIGAALLTGLALKVPMHTVSSDLEDLASYAGLWRERADARGASV
jgi:sugar (pentulose or hexulose) kinase